MIDYCILACSIDLLTVLVGIEIKYFYKQKTTYSTTINIFLIQHKNHKEEKNE